MLYYRRKLLLALLEAFDGKLTAKSLQKFLFLITRQQPAPTYDFVPYQYGCFSFQANQDVSTLKTYGYLDVVEGPNGRFIGLKQKGCYRDMLSPFDRAALLDVKNRFGTMSQNDLIRYTYRNYPYFATKSAIASTLMTTDELAEISKHKKTLDVSYLCSIGYEGISLEAYMNKLINADVRVLCDVRKNAYSQKYGFSKTPLRTACEGVGIQYVHLPELGIESAQRTDLRTQQDYDVLFAHYDRTTLKHNTDGLLKIITFISSAQRVAVTCFEANPVQCHRSHVAKAVLELMQDRQCHLLIL